MGRNNTGSLEHSAQTVGNALCNMCNRVLLAVVLMFLCTQDMLLHVGCHTDMLLHVGCHTVALNIFSVKI